ncbi:MAG: cell division protein FtsZ [Rhizomicrobium sp.]
MADEVLHAGVRGVTDLIVMPGLINLDFADIKSVISEMGKAMMGTGEAEGEDRAAKAADMAISNPLLDDVSMKGARGVLINITGGPDLMLFEVEQAANRIRAEVDPDANIIFGNTILDDMEGRIRVSVVATGIDAEQLRLPDKVQPLRPHIKPVALKPEPRRRCVPKRSVRPRWRPATPMRCTASTKRSPTRWARRCRSGPPRRRRAMILGGEDARVIEEVVPMPVVARPPAQRVEPLRPPALQPEPERRFMGLFGRKKKDEPRLEPVQQRATPRATAQPMARPAAEAPRPAASLADDLFPEHKRDEQFEIPAFLRRQSN